MTDPHPTHRRGFLASLRASFLTGLVVVLPIGLTIYFVWAVIGWIDGWILPLILLHPPLAPTTSAARRPSWNCKEETEELKAAICEQSSVTLPIHDQRPDGLLI